jgi:hypothetical protein
LHPIAFKNRELAQFEGEIDETAVVASPVHVGNDGCCIVMHCNCVDIPVVFLFFVTTQAIHFSNAKRAIPSPEGGRNGAFRGKY